MYNIALGNGFLFYHLFVYKGFIHSSTTTFLYMRSVLKVNFTPLVTSAPECSRSRCWKISTLPILGSTSNWRSMFIESTQMNCEVSVAIRYNIGGW